MIKNIRWRALLAALALALLLPYASVFAEDTELEDIPEGDPHAEEMTAEERALKKLYELAELLDGRYFTTNNKPCTDNACDKCFNENVIKCEWFSELFGYTVKSSQLPYNYFPDGALKVPRGWSCFGFAAFAQWYVFAETPTSAIAKNVTCVISPKTYSKARFDYATLSTYARPGDVIRVQKGADTSSGHSMIFISCDESGVTVLDGNFIKDDLVGIHTVPFSSKYGSLPYSACPIAITRCDNYDTLAAPADAVSEIIFTDMNSPVCHIVGKSFAMRGMISSSVVLSEVKCRIVDANTEETVFEYTENPKLRIFNIGSSEINSNTKFAALKKGLYYLEYTATDTKGFSKTWRSGKFSVADASHVCTYGSYIVGSLPKDGTDGIIIYTCKTCGSEHRISFTDHVYTDVCDEECDACGKERTAPHSFDKTEHDSTSHYKVCSLCGKKGTSASHTFKDGICTVCGFSTVAHDFDGDGLITSEDAVYLLYHGFFPDDYPTSLDTDVDKNGVFDADDAIYLLYYVFFPDEYPLD